MISLLQKVQDVFELNFTENISSILIKVARNPFACKVEDFDKAIQEKFIKLKKILLQKMSFTLATWRSFGLKCNVVVHDLALML